MTEQDSLLLTQIKSLLQKAVDAEDVTAEPWTIDKKMAFVVNNSQGLELADCECPIDASFIALSRTLLPATAKGLLVAIEALEKECGAFNFPDEDRPICHDALLSIIHGFPKELLK